MEPWGLNWIFAGLFCWLCLQKRRPQQTHNSYFIIPTSDFSCADVLIGKWWVFIVQQNWMKFDMFRWGLINWVYLDFEEMNTRASLKHLKYNKGSSRSKKLESDSINIPAAASVCSSLLILYEASLHKLWHIAWLSQFLKNWLSK